MGATINFDHLSKDEVLKVLKMMEPYDDNIQVYTRKNLNRSLDSLNQSARTPEAVGGIITVIVIVSEFVIILYCFMQQQLKTDTCCSDVFNTALHN